MALMKLPLLVLGMVGCTVAWRCSPSAPAPYRGLAVFVFNTTLPATAFTVDGNDFYDNVLNFTKSMKDAFKQEALDLFKTRFGLTNPGSEPTRLQLQLFQVNEGADQRAVVLTGESYIPAGGFRVLDGGWMITVIDPKGYQLGGDFAGTVAPAGSTFTVGHWYIVKRWCNGVPSDGYIWRVRSARPGNIALIGQARTTSGEFDVMSPRWGEGKAFNVAKYSFDGSGNADAILRNVISF